MRTARELRMVRNRGVDTILNGEGLQNYLFSLLNQYIFTEINMQLLRRGRVAKTVTGLCSEK
jgi:hypothetical protein